MFLTNKVSTTHLLAVIFILVALPIAWLYLVMAKHSEANSSSIMETGLDAEVMWLLVQNWRTENKLPKYQDSEVACSIADTRIKETSNNFSHEGFEADRFCTDCYIGENLVESPTNETRALRMWLSSEGHLANLKRNFTHSCIKCDNNRCVQIFISNL